MARSSQPRRVRRKLNKDNNFEMVVGLIQSTLSTAQLSRLTFFDKDAVYDIREQLFIRCSRDRHCPSNRRMHVLASGESFIHNHVFLFDTDLDDARIRGIFMKTLTEVVSIGPELFSAQKNYRLVELDNHVQQNKTLRLRKQPNRDFAKICRFMERKYPFLPVMYIHRGLSSKKKADNWKACTLGELMALNYFGDFKDFLKNKKISSDKFQEEFLWRAKWYLESLGICSPFFLNKYREGVFREMASYLDENAEGEHSLDLSFLSDPTDEQHINKRELLNFIYSIFTPEELKLLEQKTAKGYAWSFRDQIMDRYYFKYPSFVSEGEKQKNIRERVAELKPLLNSETVEVIRDVLFDEIERECFVSRRTYLWNREMERNLWKGKSECDDKVVKAIDILVSMVPAKADKQLSLNMSGRVFDLREQFISRWYRARLSCSPKDFGEYLSKLHIRTPYNFECWRDKERVSKTDLQAFLEEVDGFFLYPKKPKDHKK